MNGLGGSHHPDFDKRNQSGEYVVLDIVAFHLWFGYQSDAVGGRL